MSYTFIHFQDGASPLFVACHNNHGEIVDHLLIAKADVNLQRKVGMTFIYHTVTHEILEHVLHIQRLLPPWDIYNWCSETLVWFTNLCQLVLTQC